MEPLPGFEGPVGQSAGMQAQAGGADPMARGKARRSLELIEASIEILREIQPATVRAVCYRLFVQGLIDDMYYAQSVTVERIALVEDDVDDETELPGFPTETKHGDCRYRWYAEQVERESIVATVSAWRELPVMGTDA